jgi:hypothetical protein
MPLHNKACKTIRLSRTLHSRWRRVTILYRFWKLCGADQEEMKSLSAMQRLRDLCWAEEASATGGEVARQRLIRIHSNRPQELTVSWLTNAQLSIWQLYNMQQRYTLAILMHFLFTIMVNSVCRSNWYPCLTCSRQDTTTRRATTICDDVASKCLCNSKSQVD